MKHFILSLSLIAAAHFVPFVAGAATLNEISNYLNGLQTAQTRFTQRNADGSVSTGDVYMHRPGRARFEYDDEELLIIVGGGQLAIYDGRRSRRPEQYPLSQTPLDLILGRNVDLASSDMVVNHRVTGSNTRVLVRDPDRPEIGTMELVFSNSPIALRQWVINDPNGGTVTTSLNDLQQGMSLRSRLFNIVLETQSRRRD
jgi:outer membrane lipoprotein-sorting protein